MKFRYLPATIMLSAGAITSIACILNGYETLYSLKLLLFILLLFWVIGSLTRLALIKIINMETIQEEKEVKKEGEESLEVGDNSEGGKEE